MNVKKVGLAVALVASLASPAGAQSLTAEKARAIVTPFYEALNRPAEKDVAKLFEQATSADWMSCGGNDSCVPRDTVIAGFKSRGATLPDLKWEIKEVLVAGDRIVIRGEGSGTPSATFLGIPASGKSFKVMAIDVHTIENGKMKRTYHVEDWAGAMRQLSGDH